MSRQNKPRAGAALCCATALLPALLLSAVSGAGAKALHEEPPARAMPICLERIEAGIALYRATVRAPDPRDKDALALYRSRELFRNWIAKHPSSEAGALRSAPLDAEAAQDVEFCKQLAGFLFQFAKPPESDEMVARADAARQSDEKEMVARAEAAGRSDDEGRQVAGE